MAQDNPLAHLQSQIDATSAQNTRKANEQASGFGPEAFVRQYAPLAERVGRQIGVSPDALLGQWGLETGWGKSVIPGTNNLGNIKDFSGAGPKARDNMTGSTDAYRQYANPEAFGDDFVGLIGRRYKSAMGAGDDVQKFATALKTGGYAEDPDYVNKLTAAARMASQARGGQPAQAQGVDPMFGTAVPATGTFDLPSNQRARDVAKGRTWGEAIADTGTALVRGTNMLAGGVVGGVAPSSDAAQWFRDNQKSLEAWSSPYLRARKGDAEAAMAARESEWGKFTEGLYQYLSNPSLAFDTSVEQIPNMLGILIPGAVVARGAQALGWSAQAASTAGRISAAAAGAGLNGGQARDQAYSELVQQPVERWRALPEFVELEQQIGSEAARKQLASDMSRLPGVVGAVAGAISGATGLERVVLGGAGQGAGSALRRAGQTFLAEQGGELVEELAPQFATNMQVQQIDPTRGAFDQFGATAAQTVVASAPFGAAAAIAEYRHTPKANSPISNAVGAVQNAQADAAAVAAPIVAQPVPNQGATPPNVPPTQPPAGQAGPAISPQAAPAQGPQGQPAQPTAGGLTAEREADILARMAEQGEDDVNSLRVFGPRANTIVPGLDDAPVPGLTPEQQARWSQQAKSQAWFADPEPVNLPEQAGAVSAPNLGVIGVTPLQAEQDARRAEARAKAEAETAAKKPAGANPAYEPIRQAVAAGAVLDKSELVMPDGTRTTLNKGQVLAARNAIKQRDAASPIAQAANQAATSPTNSTPVPTDGQKAAGNYKKGKVRISGLPVTIENPAGSERTSKKDDPNPWRVVMPAHYGYINRTEGADGDQVDLFIGPKEDNGRFWIVNQSTPDGKRFDEHKVITGVDSAQDAVALYKASFADGFGDRVFASISEELDADALKAKLPDLKKARPVKAAVVQPDLKQPGLIEPPPFVAVGQSVIWNGERARVTGLEGARARISVEGERAERMVPALALQPLEGRQDGERRKRVQEMNDEEKALALLVDDLTGIGSKRAFLEATDGGRRVPDGEVLVSIDLDGLGWINKEFGQSAGDTLLRLMGTAARAAVPLEGGSVAAERVFHYSGDEFYAILPEDQAQAVMGKMADLAAQVSFEARGEKSGQAYSINGVRFSYGTGLDKKEADGQLIQDKKRREASGERATAGQQPPTVRVLAEQGRDGVGAGADAAGRGDQGEDAGRNVAGASGDAQTVAQGSAQENGRNQPAAGAVSAENRSGQADLGASVRAPENVRISAELGAELDALAARIEGSGAPDGAKRKARALRRAAEANPAAAADMADELRAMASEYAPDAPQTSSQIEQPAASLQGSAQPDLDAELQDALGKLGDVLGDVFGAKLNATGQQYSAKDLLPALSKVLELLMAKGARSFAQAVGRAAGAMRANEKTRPHLDKVSPRQWKAAYNSVAEFIEGTQSEDEVNALTTEQVLSIVNGQTAPARPAPNGAEFGELYHGTSEPFERFEIREQPDRGSGLDHQGRAIYLTDDAGGYARFFARNGNAKRAVSLSKEGRQADAERMVDSWGTVLSVRLADDARILRLEDAPQNIKDLFSRSVGSPEVGAQLRQAVLDAGYDGLNFEEPSAPEGWPLKAGARTTALYVAEKANITGSRPQAAPASSPAPTKSRSPAAKANAERDAARAAYFTPGNIVRSMGGFDEVLAYSPPDESGRWSVTVQEVREATAGRWVRVGKPQDARNHSTEPSAAELKRGPVARAPYLPGAEVPYTEPRADGQPFANAPARGTPAASRNEGAPSLLDLRNMLIDVRTAIQGFGPVVDDRWLEKERQLVKAIKEAEAEQAARPAAEALPTVDTPDGKVLLLEAEFGQFSKSLREAEDDGLFDPNAKKVRAADLVKDQPRLSLDEARARIDEWRAEARRQGESGVNSGRVVLSLFDHSGEWSRPWAEAGYEVFPFDIQDGVDINEFSVEYLNQQFGFSDVFAILAAPPCTDFASSGAQFWKAKDADGRTEASNELVRQALRTVEYYKPAVWAMENPVGRIASLNGLPEPLYVFDPAHFGDPYTKKTLLWGNFETSLPLAPVEPTEGSKITEKISGRDKNARSLTPEGFAYAFFMANNAESMGAATTLAREFKGVPKALLDQALASGLSATDIANELKDPYFQDGGAPVATEALRNLIAERGGVQADTEREDWWDSLSPEARRLVMNRAGMDAMQVQAWDRFNEDGQKNLWAARDAAKDAPPEVLAKRGDILVDADGENAWRFDEDVTRATVFPIRVTINWDMLSERKQSVSKKEFDARLAEDARFRAKAFKPPSASAKTAYVPPSMDDTFQSISNRWRDAIAGRAELSPVQAAIVDALREVQQSSRERSFSVWEPLVAKALGLPDDLPRQLEDGFGVRGGRFGADVFFADQYITRKDASDREQSILEAIRPEPGLKLGTIRLNTLQEIRNAVVESVDGPMMTIVGDRGRNRVQTTLSPVGLMQAIDRSHEAGRRSTSFKDFKAKRAEERPAAEVVQERAQQTVEPKTLTELQQALERGDKVRFDYAGVDGTTLWVEKTPQSWVVKEQSDGSPAVFTNGPAKPAAPWSQDEAVRRAADKARFRFEEWKPTASPEPAPAAAPAETAPVESASPIALTVDDVPPVILRAIEVQATVRRADGRAQKVPMPAETAINSLRKQMDDLRALLNCVKS